MSTGRSEPGLGPAPITGLSPVRPDGSRWPLRSRPLGRVIARCAIAAGTEDPRFPAVTPGELHELEIELSIMGPLEPVADLGEIHIGRHGLVVEQGWHRGLLLPQVATEWHWDVRDFVAETCRKAGLSRDAWKSGAKIWKFEAEVFGESG